MTDFSCEFLDDGLKRIELFRDNILKIKHNEIDRDLLSAAFRAINTIKESGRSAGFVHLANAAQYLESALDALCQGPLRPIYPEEIERFLRWSDFIEAFLFGLRRDSLFVLDPQYLMESDANAATIAQKYSPNLAELSPSPPEMPAQFSAPPHANDAQLFPIHFRSYMASYKAISSDMAWSLIALSGLGLPSTSTKSFTSVALDVLRTQCDLPEVQHICFVKRLGLSNQYEVISSAVTLPTNVTPTGGQSFIHPESSLELTTPGILTVLNFPLIVKSFESEGLKSQHAVRQLDALGFRSGICLSLGTKTRNDGLLFINSKSDFFLNLPEDKLPIFSMLATYATVCLHECSLPEPLYYEVFKQHPKIVTGGQLDVDQIAFACAIIDKTIGTAPVALSVNSDNPAETVVSHGSIGFLIARIASLKAVTFCDVQIERRAEMLHVDCQLSVDGDTNVLSSNFLSVNARTAEALGYSQSIIGTNALRYAIPINNH